VFVLVQLNEIQVIITLKMHQVKCVLEGKMPPDLSHTIVFTTSGLKRLRTRIDELKDEKEELRKNQKQLRREHVQLSKSRKIKEAKLKELEARARDVQVPCLASSFSHVSQSLGSDNLIMNSNFTPLQSMDHALYCFRVLACVVKMPVAGQDQATWRLTVKGHVADA
jgi:hypothetical protein